MGAKTVKDRTSEPLLSSTGMADKGQWMGGGASSPQALLKAVRSPTLSSS